MEFVKITHYLETSNENLNISWYGSPETTSEGKALKFNLIYQIICRHALPYSRLKVLHVSAIKASTHFLHYGSLCRTEYNICIVPYQLGTPNNNPMAYRMAASLKPYRTWTWNCSTKVILTGTPFLDRNS